MIEIFIHGKMNDIITLTYPHICPKALRGGAVVIGNFDGVHLGHQSLIHAALETGFPVTCLSFNPNPREFFTGKEIFTLTPLDLKREKLASLGVQGLALCPFNAVFSSLSPQDFIDKILINWLGAKAVFTGENFKFGKGRAGNTALLSEQFFEFKALPSFNFEREPASSTRIRNALSEGNVKHANALLGAPFRVRGEVIHGAKRGRDLGFPTANIPLLKGNALKFGIYAVKVLIDGVEHHGVASYGTRPMFDDGLPLLETYILDFKDDLYGKTLTIDFYDYLRGEAKFESLEALIQQMHKDCDLARKILSQ